MLLATPGRAGKPKLFSRRPPALERLEHRWVPSEVRYLGGFSANTLPRGDDNSSGAVPLGFTIDFHGRAFSSLYVSNNGNVTFGTPPGGHSPHSLNYLQRPIIAPFFADVDTRAVGEVRYGRYVQEPGRPHDFSGREAFSVIWKDVGYYNQQADRTNTFQLILIDRGDVAPGAFDVEFNYDQIEWQSIRLAAGPYARAGYSTGSDVPAESVELAGSGARDGLLDLPTRADVRFEFRPNDPPVLSPVPHQVVAEGGTLDVTLTATDPDAGQTLTYSLLGGPPGAAIDPATGRVTWTPTGASPLGLYSFRVAVTDSGNIPWTDTETFTVRLENAPPDVDVVEPAASHHPAGREFVLQGRFDDPGQNDWSATVDFGDGVVEPLALNSDKSFTLRHTFLDEGSFTVLVNVTDSNGGAGSATYTVNVLPAGSFGRIETSLTVTAEPGETAQARLDSASGHSLGLTYSRSDKAKDAGSVFVAIYTSAPVDTRRVGLFFDLQSGNLHEGDEIVLLVEGKTLLEEDFEFGYFDRASGTWVNLLRSPGLAEVTIDEANGRMIVRFKVTDIFDGTVFTVSLPSTGTTTTGTIQPPTASAGDTGGLTRNVTFTSNTQLSLALTASRDAQQSASGTSQGSQAANAAANGVANSGGSRSSAFSLTAGVGGREEAAEEDIFWRWLQTDEGLLQLLLDGVDPNLILPRKAAAQPKKADGVVPAADAKEVVEPAPVEQADPAPPKPDEEPILQGEFAAAALFALSPYLVGQRRRKRKKARR